MNKGSKLGQSEVKSLNMLMKDKVTRFEKITSALLQVLYKIFSYQS